tara:strand:- start:672 stop:1391 length:720 start_codon:yes stop_codon:yes gene_type:complete
MSDQMKLEHKKLNVLIPMAGNGQRFKDAGYKKPKPFIDVNGQKMIEVVMDTITPASYNKIILISIRNHSAKEELKNYGKNLEIIEIDNTTEGALQTVLLAEDHIKDRPLLLCNCDQKTNFDVDLFIKKAEGYDGSVVTFTANNPHHSYVTVTDNAIDNIIEKEVISNKAVTGVYFFQNGSDLVDAAKSVIKFNKKEKGEFYVSSALQLMIYKGLRLTTFDAESIMLGTPEELERYLNTL